MVVSFLTIALPVRVSWKKWPGKGIPESHGGIT